MSATVLSYSQRFEDLYLASCFPGRASGFYIDIGAGHPVYDNVTFLFYLRGWSGITVEPNPRLARLSRAIRRRDKGFEQVVGAAEGEAAFHLVDDYHGLSTTIGAHAQSAQTEFGKASQTLRVPMTTLTALCKAQAVTQVDILKIDVEGAEGDVIAGADWMTFRPKVVIAEALAPYSLAPAWDVWEPTLAKHGYRYIRFDSLNRYYVAEEERDIAQHLRDAPDDFPHAIRFRDFKPALEDGTHPDHRLAVLLRQDDMADLPLVAGDILFERLTSGLSAEELAAPADGTSAAALARRVFGDDTPILQPAGAGTLRDLYVRLIDSDPFRTALGRISASSAW